MIEVRGLTKQYGRISAIADVSFQVQKGEILGFLGPNGAGKTTTMRILTGFTPPTKGSATIAEFDVREEAVEVKRRVGYLPENAPLYREMVVSRYLGYVAEIKGVPKDGRKEEVRRVLERCGLEDMARRVIGNLSKGYRQRVALAQALVGSPPVLILDEPTVGLDPKQIIAIRQTIRQLAGNHTVLLSTHILPEVSMLCDRVVIIHKGRIVAEDKMANLARGNGRRVEVEVRGPRERVLEVLQNVPGVGEVRDAGPGKFAVVPEGAADIAPQLSRSVVNADLDLVRLDSKQHSLEEIFIDAIADEGDGES